MYRISFNKASFDCSDDNDILRMARKQSVKIPYGCANGGCGMCKIRVLRGKYQLGVSSKTALTDKERENGYALACKTYPLSNLEITLADE